MRNYNPDTPVILISGHANIDIAVKAIKEGAFYFIEKPPRVTEVFFESIQIYYLGKPSNKTI